MATCRASIACAAIVPRVRFGDAVGELDAFDAVDPAEIGIGHGDRAGKRQRVHAVAASHAEKADIGDDEGVIARAADHDIGAAIADQDVVAESPTMSLGAPLPMRTSSPAVPRCVTWSTEPPMVPDPNST